MNSPKTISGNSQNHFGKAGPEVVPNSRISLDSGNGTTADPTPRNLSRILLSEAASKALLEAGDAFLIVGRASHPDDGRRVVIHCLPIPKAQADAARRVAMGEARAVAIKKPATSPAEA